MYTIFTLLFIAVIAGGLIWAYIHHLGQKGEKLNLINKGICPECKEHTIEITDQKSGGCCGPSIVDFACRSCGYKDSYVIEKGSCGV
ncbi:MAG: hypothetical protein B6D59_05195 [Campylobacteraceae bacterium 4484_4]|nr:MAG: hypothetical protein B6D59_05195 [Campylobacteraceae bacterium 4484_4]